MLVHGYLRATEYASKYGIPYERIWVLEAQKRVFVKRPSPWKVFVKDQPPIPDGSEILDKGYIRAVDYAKKYKMNYHRIWVLIKQKRVEIVRLKRGKVFLKDAPPLPVQRKQGCLTVSQFSKKIGVSYAAVYRRISNGYLPKIIDNGVLLVEDTEESKRICLDKTLPDLMKKPGLVRTARGKIPIEEMLSEGRRRAKGSAEWFEGWEECCLWALGRLKG